MKSFFGHIKAFLFIISIVLTSQSLVSCRAEGDIYPELKDIYTTVEESKEFELDQVFDQRLHDIEILGDYLFVYYSVYALDADSTESLSYLRCEILKDGEAHYQFSFDKDHVYKPFQIDKDRNVYVGNMVVYAPNYNQHEALPMIDPENKEKSLALLREIVNLSTIEFTKKHFDLLGEEIDYTKEDSLINELLDNYSNDVSSTDSAYREYLFFFLFDADSYLWTKNYTTVFYKGKTYCWNSYDEGSGRYKMFRKKIYNKDKSNYGSFGARSTNFFGKVKYDNPRQSLQVIRFDKAIEEWGVKGFGAPHAGIGVFWPDPAKIWYYEVLKNKESVLKYKVRENDNDNLEPFNYLTSKNEFYLYDSYSRAFLRVRMTQ